MKLLLAPMEGLTDVHMRDILTRMAGPTGFDWCVTEFLRITDRVMPARTFYDLCPELLRGGKTAAGTPVHVQLLGCNAQPLADNAARVVELGAPAIDLNFGCPAKTVNKHRGGAILLDEPELIYSIVKAVRDAVPAHIPVSAKMRLGVKDRNHMIENAQGVEAAGANWLTVHARTKEDGYRPPAYWDAIGEIRAQTKIQIFANGDINTLADAERCRKESGCDDLMIGRRAVIRPDFIRQLRGEDVSLSWEDMLVWQRDFLKHMLEAANNPALDSREGVAAKWNESGAVGRYKQWLAMLTQGYSEAVALFAAVKRLKRFTDIEVTLLNAGSNGGKS